MNELYKPNSCTNSLRKAWNCKSIDPESLLYVYNNKIEYYLEFVIECYFDFRISFELGTVYYFVFIKFSF